MAPLSRRCRVLALPGDVELLQNSELDCQQEVPTYTFTQVSISPESPSRADDHIGQASMDYLTLHFCSLCHRLVFPKVLAIPRTEFL